MKNNFILIIIFLISVFEAKTQELKGIWLSSHSVELLKTKTAYSRDTTYYQSNTIIDFIDHKNVIFKTLGKEKSNGKYKIKDSIINITIGNDTINGKIYNSKIELILSETKREITTIIFTKITPTELTSSQLKKIKDIYNTSWKTETNKDSRSFNLKFYFLDKDSLDFMNKTKLKISQITKYTGYTTEGNYTIDSYKNHFFIGVFNYDNLNEYVYHIYKYKNQKYFAKTYDYMHFSHAPPPLKDVIFSKKENLTKNEKEKISKLIIGEWKGIKNPIPFDTIYSKYEKLENQKLKLKLDKNKQFELKYSGFFSKKNEKKSIIKELSGYWKLGNSGDFIEFTTKDSRIFYFTIKKLSENKLKIYCRLESLEQNNFYYSNTLIELEK